MKASSNYKIIHPKFKLNGVSYTSDTLKELGYNLEVEGTSFQKAIANFLYHWLDDKPTLTVKTSGSTGNPKNIFLRKQHMVNSALATGEYFDLKAGDTALLCLPSDYIAGKMMLVRAMVLGLELDYVEPSSNPIYLLSKTYDFSAMVPLQLENSLSEIEKIKILIVGGAAVSRPLKEKVQGKTTAIFETYGMTETITHVAVKSTDKVTEHSRSHFKGLPNVAFSVDSRECLVISAPKITDHKVVTNDMVNLISETEFEWLGRYDNMINSGGIKLFPEQIEAKLKSILDVPYFVAGIPDDTLGQKLVLVIEGKVNEHEVLEAIKYHKTLSKFEIPKEVYSIPSFIYTNTAKVNRRKTIRLINN